MKRVVVVTGVNGGIGSAVAAVFDAAGWHVIGVDRCEDTAMLHIQHFIKADLSQPEIPTQIAVEISAIEGRIDALINNAAIQICKPLLEIRIADWENSMAVNVRAAFLMLQAAYPLLKESKGSVVNVSSVHAIATSHGMAAYAASKGALSALTRAAALELASDGIRVNAVAPGAVDTGMLRQGLTRGRFDGNNMEEMVNKIGLLHPLGKVAAPDEIAKCILFLADSRQSSFITGHSLVADGGALAKLSTE